MSGTILLVGCGNMGFAMLSGWLKAADELDFYVVEPTDALRQRAADAGARVYEKAEDLPTDLVPALCFLAVKPQVMDRVAPAYAGFAGGPVTFVSVAAGVTMATLSTLLPGPTPLIRCMPNTPAAIGLGMLVSCANDHVSNESRDLADRLLATSGTSAWIDREDLMDAVTAISGSGPAYVFHFIECLAEAGAKLGLPADLSLTLAIQTAMGAGRLAADSDTPPDTLRQQVTSPGGTTAAALAVFMEDDALRKLTKTAATAARDRGVELGKSD